MRSNDIMYLTASQILRRKYLDARFQTGKKFTKKELHEALNEYLLVNHTGTKGEISVRTFEEDWRWIKSQIEEQGGVLMRENYNTEVRWYYEDKNISAFETISADNKMRFKAALSLLGQIKGIAFTDELNDTLKQLDLQLKNEIDHRGQIIQFQSDLIADGSQFLSDIYEAILGKTVISFSYKPFNANESLKKVHPYLLKQFNGRWFLFGYAKEEDRIEIYALDRIASQKIKAVKETYWEPDGIFDPQTYFNDIIGVTKHKSVAKENIKILIQASSAPYVLSKKWHHSQDLLKTNKDGSILIQLTVIPNRELKNLIMSMGSAATVVSPETLVNEMKSEINAMLINYADVTSAVWDTERS